MPELSAKAKLSIEIGAEVASAELGLRGFMRSVEDFRKVAEKAGKTSIFPSPAALKAQVSAGIEPVIALRKQLAETMRDVKTALAVATDPGEVEKLKIIQANATRASQQIVQSIRQLKAESEAKGKASFFQTLELQAKAGLIPITKLREEMVKTLRADIGALPNRADFRTNDNILGQLIQLQQLDKGLKNSEQQVETFQAKLSRIGGALQQAFLPLAGISAGIAGLLGSSAKSFADFERTLNTIQAVSGVTSEELEKIKQTSLDLGQSTIFSNQQVAESYLELSKAGFSARESTEALPGLLNLAAAAGGRLDVATQAVAEGMRSFGLETSRTGEFTDILAQGANKSSAEIEDMANAFKQVAPIARQTDQSIQDVSALLAILANNAVKGADAGSDLRNIITRLAKPSKETSQALAELAKHGVNVKDVFGNLPKFFKDTAAALQNYNSQGKASIASSLAGQENLKTFLILASQAPETINAMVAAMKNSNGATQQMADTINQGLFASLEQLNGSFDTLKTTLGEALSPAIKAVAGVITELNTALGQNKSVAQFTAGFLAASGAMITATTALSGFLLLLPILKAATISLAASFPALVAAISVIAVAVGLATVAMNQHNQAAQDAKITLGELRNEINEATQAQLKESKSFQDSAKKIDELQKKTKLTKDEKLLMDDAINKLRANFSKYGIDLDQLVEKYGSLTKAIKEARIEQATFEREKDLKEKIKKVQEDIQALGSPLEGVGEAGILFVDQKKLKDQQALLKQQSQLQQDFKNSRKDVIHQQEVLDAAERKAVADAKKGTQGFTTPSNTADNKVKTAKEELTKKLEALEVELTNFTAGEFAKRRADAERDYQDSVRRIKELAKTAKASQKEITQGLTDASQLRNARLAEIAKQESRELKDAKRTIDEIKANAQSLNAAITLTNPFDDITADAEKARVSITRDYALAVRALQDQVTKNPKLANIANETKIQLREQYEAALKQNDIFNQQRQFDEGRALLDLGQQNRVLQAEISNDTLEIEKATNEKIIADLQVRIDNQKNILQNAINALNANPLNKDLQLGHQKSIEDLNNLQLEQDKAVSQGSLRESAIQSDAIERVITSLKQEIDLYGKRPELVQKLIAAYSVYLEQLEKEKNLTGQSAEKQAEITQNIVGAKQSQRQLRSESSLFGKVLTSLQSITPPTGAFGDFFSTVVGGLSSLQQSFQSFGKGNFFDFLKSNKGVSQVLQFAGTAVSALGRANTAASRFAATLGGALSGAGTGAVIGGAVGGPIGAGIGAAAGAIIGGTIGFIQSGSKKAAEEAQKRIQRTQEFTSRILAQADSNNIQDLQKKLNSILKFKSGGGDAFKVKKQAADQLRSAIKNRKQVIDEAMKQIGLQNQAIQLQLNVFKDQPLQALDIDRQIKLQDLQAETEKALEQFKDSLAVQQQIQQSFELQRQLLLKTSAEDIIQTVIQEQNTIRELRAQELVDRAKASDNAIALINAQLQQQLVAIDNELAAFQGAEEEKTAFLAAEAAKRDAVIKDSQKQMNSLFKQGLDILNEGLVVGQSKFDDQQKRLRELFGSSLNPFGLIQASGDLLQKSITIASGAIQFTMEGVQDLQGIIDQLNSNPALQARFMDALNQLVLRTT